MNKVILIGRITKDPEVKLTANQTQFVNFTVACDRRYKDQNGDKQADFINCVAWRQTAAFVGKYFHKGSKIALTGSIQTRSYDDQSGQKRFVTEVVVDDVEFVESKSSAEGGNSYNNSRPSESNNQPARGSVASAAPTAPKTQIDDTDSGFGGDAVNLPFEV
ncbi:MAG: single-stranded DNA-binding protein [Saccharofermentans sp.]|nr:single-stranded DNA-binding protein [Saccharofermentans sp.]